MRRDRYQMLNGYWNCAVTKSALMPGEFPYRILVPFSPECSLAKFSHNLKPDEYLWYYRKVTIPQGWRGKVLVHFDAVDQQADVFFDGDICSRSLDRDAIHSKCNVRHLCHLVFSRQNIRQMVIFSGKMADCKTIIL